MTSGPDRIAEAARAAAASFHVFFTGESPAPGTFASRLDNVLGAIVQDLNGASAANLYAPPSNASDPVDALNLLAESCTVQPFARNLDRMLLERLAALTPRETPSRATSGQDPDTAFFYRHAVHLAELLKDLIPDYCGILAQRSGPAVGDAVPRLRPSAVHLSSAQSALLRMKPGAVAMEVARASADDSFAAGRIFRHRDGVFTPLTLPSIRNVGDFYGFQPVRRMFQEHFKAFSEGRGNLPLLISSLPGLGKTQMSIAYSLSFPNITLIIPEPADIAIGLERLIAVLAKHPDRKFMLFFDDIDAATTDWYYFRSNIGGTFSLPPNITITIASNQRFPANISSRGRGCEFPMFDEIRCQEMILDFLTAKGLREPSKNLVAVIASDYVSEFGQKQFEELSPRTLVRYLDHYLSDPAKRKTLMDEANSDVVPQPDPQVFYEENVKLMRSIHGEAALEQFRKDAIHVS